MNYGVGQRDRVATGREKLTLSVLNLDFSLNVF